MTGSVSEHVFDELPALLIGELDRQATSEVTAHLRACDDCRQDLVMVVTASAALRAAGRIAPELVRSGEVGLPDPKGLLAEITGGGEGADGAGEARSDPSAAETSSADGLAGAEQPDAPTSAGVSRAGANDSDPSAEDRPLVAKARPARRRGWWSAAAAGVLLLAGTVAGVLVYGPTTPVSSGRQLALAPVGRWTATGAVTMSGGTMSVDPKNLPAAPPGHFYELWLVNQKQLTQKLLPVGVLSADGPSQYRLSQAILSEYNAVAVSFEPDDGNAAYSGISVMSGRYG